MSSSLDHVNSSNDTNNNGNSNSSSNSNSNSSNGNHNGHYNVGYPSQQQQQQQQQQPRHPLHHPQQQQQQPMFYAQQDYPPQGIHQRQQQPQQQQQRQMSAPFAQQQQQRPSSPPGPQYSSGHDLSRQTHYSQHQHALQQQQQQPFDGHNQQGQTQQAYSSNQQPQPQQHYSQQGQSHGQAQQLQQGQGYTQEQAEQQQGSASASASVSGSSPPRSENDSNLRFRITLEAQTAAMQRQDETPVTYLNKGQFYTVGLEDTEEYDGEITSVIRVTFHDASHRRLAARYWSFWLSQQANPKSARALDIEKALSSGMLEVQSKTFDRISFRWNGRAGAKLMVRFNCLSTDFSRIKGVKGIPLRVHMDTYLDNVGGHSSGSASNNKGDGPAMERAFAKIKLFRDKGAERKNKDDHKHLEKMWDKMRGKNADTNPLVNMLAPVQSVSLFSECTDPPEGSGEDETLDLSETLAHDQDATDSGGATGGEHYDAGSSSRQDHDGLSSTGDQPTSLAPANKKRRRAAESGGNNGSGNGMTSNGNGNSNNNGLYDPQHSQVGMASSSALIPSHGGGGGALATSAELLLDRDPSYVPQARKKRPVLCLYIKIGGEAVYRAVYLEKCTLADLIQKLSEKLEIQSSTISCVYRKTIKKELMVRVDDAMVAQMTDELDMVVEYDFNQQDGSVNLTLKY